MDNTGPPRQRDPRRTREFLRQTARGLFEDSVWLVWGLSHSLLWGLLWGVL